MVAARIAIDLGARAEARTIVSACASGTEAIGAAIDRIRGGHVDVAVAGGTEDVITPTIMAAFASLRALSTGPNGPENASRPFDQDRDGFVLGEGAGFLVLEDEEHALQRGARIYCEAAGWGLSADAHHMTAPRPDGQGVATAIRKALTDAAATPDDVVHINAHATATPAGGRAEALALRTVFGEHTLPVTAPKGAIGHLRNFIARTKTSPSAPPLLMGRARATWLVDAVEARMHLPTLMAAAGLTTLRSIDRVMPYVRNLPAEQVAASLRGCDDQPARTP
ncbi:beta-ketoacyl-[acyl-carrier-protein] synthase family protein [Streptomyces hypolithicus]